MSEQYANAAQTTLKTAVNKVVTTLELEALATAGIPTSAPFRILVDNGAGGGLELMLVTAVNAGEKKLTVTRAAEPFAGASTAEEHPKGASVTVVYTAGALLADKAEILSPYRLVFETVGRISTAGVAGTKYIFDTTTGDAATLGVGSSNIACFNLVAERLAPAVSGCTPKLYLDAICQTATAPNVNIVVSLYPVVAGATISLGTKIASTDITFAKPASNSLVAGNSGDFALPADGIYAIGGTVDGTPVNGFTVQAMLRTHYVTP